MDLRKKIFIIGGLIIVFLLVIFLALFFTGNKNKKTSGIFSLQNNEQQPAMQKQNSTATNNIGPINKVIEGVKIINQSPDEVYVKQLSSIFVERFNTYSNRNQNSHITDAIALATKQMAIWLNTQKINQSGEYLGATTQVLAVNIESLVQNKARVSVGVKELSYKGTEETADFRTAFVDLIKENNEWKVNGFYWEE